MVNFAQVSLHPSNSSLSLASTMSVYQLVALTLEKIICENSHQQSSKISSLILSDPFVKFQSSYEPDVSVEYYIQRIFKHSKCSDSCLIIMLVYIDRLIEKQGLVLTKLNAHRVIITSLMVAAKYHDDLFYNNAYFAKLGGIPLSELNMLEVDFLQLQDFSMFVDANLYDQYATQLQNYHSHLQQQHYSSPRSTAVHPVGSPFLHPHQLHQSHFLFPVQQAHHQQQSCQFSPINHKQQQHVFPMFLTSQSCSPPLFDQQNINSVVNNSNSFLFPSVQTETVYDSCLIPNGSHNSSNNVFFSTSQASLQNNAAVVLVAPIPVPNATHFNVPANHHNHQNQSALIMNLHYPVHQTCCFKSAFVPVVAASSPPTMPHLHSATGLFQSSVFSAPPAYHHVSTINQPIMYSHHHMQQQHHHFAAPSSTLQPTLVAVSY